MVHVKEISRAEKPGVDSAAGSLPDNVSGHAEFYSEPDQVEPVTRAAERSLEFKFCRTQTIQKWSENTFEKHKQDFWI